MKAPNRDILVLVKDQCPDSPIVKQELERLNHMLISFETMDNLCRAHEIHDLNRYEKMVSYEKVYRTMRERRLKPFVFVFNKN